MDRRLMTAWLAAVIVTCCAPPAHAQWHGLKPLRPLAGEGTPVRSCDSLSALVLPNTTIESATTESVEKTAPPACRVTAVVTHPPAGDKVRVWIALPLTSWNGRFQAVGGAGFAGGRPSSLDTPVRTGFAAASTDGGHDGGSGSFALDGQGRLNWQSIRNFGHLALRDMSVTAKAVAAAFFGSAPRRSYFVGCSTGGHQGLTIAQRYPAEYDGIVSVAPAINWSRFLIADLWPQVAMADARTIVPACKLEAATAAAVAACDKNDGVEDGVLDDPRSCAFDPAQLVGTSSASCAAFTDGDALVIRRIWEGARREDGGRLWYGLPRGTALTPLAATGGEPLAGRPFRIALEWLRFFLAQDPTFDATTLTRSRFEQFFDQSAEQYTAVIGGDNPDLSGFRKRGGKLIIWHGWADALIPPEGAIDYYERVVEHAGGQRDAERFARLFMAPGVGHCAGGPGPLPAGELDTLVNWVENGKAPKTLGTIRRDAAGNATPSRPVCAYPLVARYKGSGSTEDPSSYRCRRP